MEEKMLNISNGINGWVGLCLLLSIAVFSGACYSEPGFSQAVVGITTDKVYLYTEEGDDAESGPLSKGKIEKSFGPLNVPWTNKDGIAVEKDNLKEGLVAIRLKENDELIWLELMSVDLVPGNKLKCPESVMSKNTKPEQGLTIGFGDHCE
jgi:hypothetical protein